MFTISLEMIVNQQGKGIDVNGEYYEDDNTIELKIESNSGNKEYTCLYKFRVHGKLFEQENLTDSIKEVYWEEVMIII